MLWGRHFLSLESASQTPLSSKRRRRPSSSSHHRRHAPFGGGFRALETVAGDGDDRRRTRLPSTRGRVARKRGIYAGTHIRDTFAELTRSGIYILMYTCHSFTKKSSSRICARDVRVFVSLQNIERTTPFVDHQTLWKGLAESSCFWTSEERRFVVSKDEFKTAAKRVVPVFQFSLTSLLPASFFVRAPYRRSLRSPSAWSTRCSSRIPSHNGSRARF